MARTARGLATKEAFREGARKVFARDGYLNARLVDIAAEAGRSPGLLYQHYDGKEAILADLGRDIDTKLQAAVREPFRSEASPVAALRLALGAFWELYRDHLAEMVGISQAALIDPAFAAQWKEIHSHATDLVTQGITQAQAAGYCPGLAPAVAAEALVTMVEQACLHWLHPPLNTGEPPATSVAVDTLWTLWSRGVYWTGPTPTGLPPERRRNGAKVGAAPAPRSKAAPAATAATTRRATPSRAASAPARSKKAASAKATKKAAARKASPGGRQTGKGRTRG